MKKVLLLILLFISPFLKSEYVIKGTLNDSQNKYKAIQLYFISSMDELNSVDSRTILNEVEIDSFGNFYLAGNDLPNEKALYRLALVEEFSNTFIQTGKFRNYNLLVLDNNSKVELNGCGDVSLSFSNCKIYGSEESEEIQFFYDDLLKQFFENGSSGPEIKSETKVEFLKARYLEQFQNYCDSSNYLIPRLVSFSLSQKFRDDSNTDYSWENNFLNNLKNDSPSNPYVKDLEFILATKQAMHYKTSNLKLWNWLYILGTLSVLSIAMNGFLFFRVKKHSKSSNIKSRPSLKELEKLLSKREREVLYHIQLGKSNKEIAEAMFIEVSTVKSHQTKIYQKLGVKSRNELLK